MRTLQLLVDDWKARAQLLYAQGPRRLTNTRRLLNLTCVLAIVWTTLMATRANIYATLCVSVAFAIAFIVMAPMFAVSASRNWDRTRLRAVSGFGWLLLLLLSLELICIGIATRQWPWVIACIPGAVIGSYSLNHAIDKLQKSLWRVKNPV